MCCKLSVSICAISGKSESGRQTCRRTGKRRELRKWDEYEIKWRLTILLLTGAIDRLISE